MTTPDLTPEVVEELRRLAEKATPGPWMRMTGRELVRAIRGDLAVPLFEALEPICDPALAAPTVRVGKEVVFRANSAGARKSASMKQQAANAAYIAAANPAVILALLAERAADKARIAHLERRETELLATTNRYLARAREAEARLSHLEEQARKDGEAFAAMFRDPLPGHDADACELMDLIAEVRLAARARLSDREGK